MAMFTGYGAPERWPLLRLTTSINEIGGKQRKGQKKASHPLNKTRYFSKPKPKPPSTFKRKRLHKILDVSPYSYQSQQINNGKDLETHHQITPNIQ